MVGAKDKETEIIPAPAFVERAMALIDRKERSRDQKQMLRLKEEHFILCLRKIGKAKGQTGAPGKEAEGMEYDERDLTGNYGAQEVHNGRDVAGLQEVGGVGAYFFHILYINI